MNAMIRLTNVLVPVDFSEPSRTAVNYGLSLALEFDSKLLLAHIAPYDKRIYEEAKVRLMELIPTDLRERLHFETIVKGGDVRDEILGIVKDKEIDLVIMGSHGRGAVELMIL